MVDRITIFWLTVTLCVVSVLSVSAQSPLVDGYVRDPVTGVVEAPYVVQGIIYTQDQVTGDFAGYLFRAEDETNYYFAFAQSVHVNDNTYGKNSIDWDRKQAHRLRDLTNSEHAEIRLYDSNDDLSLDFFLDYVTDDRKTGEMTCLGATGGDGTMITGNPDHITAASSSMAWNFNLANPLYPDRANSSPARVPTNTYDSGTTADPNTPWIYELVYEWSVAKAAFASGEFGRIEIREVHNSPLKSSANPVPVPVLNVQKTSSPASGSSVRFSETITYTVTASNMGFTALTDVVVTDAIDDNLDFVEPLDGGVYDEATRTITWPTVASLGPGETLQVHFAAAAVPISVEDLNIHNQALISSPDLPAPAETNVTEHFILPQPDLIVTKSCPPQVVYGQQFDYTVTVINAGVSPAMSSQLVDTLPAEVTYVSASPAPTSVAGRTLTFDLGDVDYLQEITVTITVQAAVASGTAINTAVVSTTEAESDLTNNTASATAQIVAADIAVDKTGPAQMVAGDVGTYTITVSNIGTATAADVVLTDMLPDSVSYVSASPAPTSVSGHALTFDLGDIGAGASTSITVDVQANATEGTATNTATATTTTGEGGQGTSNNSDTHTSTFVAPDVAVDKTGPATAVAGEGATYTIVVSNVGTATAKNVVLTDALPDGVSYASASPAPASVNGQTVTFGLGDIDVNGSASITIQVTVNATASTLTNTATASTASIEGGQGTANNSDSCSSDVLAADIAVVKAGPAEMIAGETASYTITVTNEGTARARNVTLVDTLPEGVTYVSAMPGPVSVNGRALTFSLGDIAVGGSAAITIDVDVTATGGTVTNIAVGSTDSVEGGQGTANNQDTADSTILAPDVVVTKVADPATAVTNSPVTFTITFANQGTSPANDVVITDTVPAGLFEGDAFAAQSTVGTVVVDGLTVTVDAGTLAVDASGTLVITGTVTASTAAVGSYQNAVTVTTSSTQSDDTNDSDTADVEVVAPVLALSKTSVVTQISADVANTATVGAAEIRETASDGTTDTVAVGSQIAYTITVSNSGGADATNVVLADTLPDGVTIVANPDGGAVDGGTVTWNIPSVAAGESASVTITVQTVTP